MERRTRRLMTEAVGLERNARSMLASDQLARKSGSTVAPDRDVSAAGAQR